MGTTITIVRDDIGDFGCVAVITALDLMHTDDLAEQERWAPDSVDRHPAF